MSTSRATSETAAANDALRHLGEPPISSLSDDTTKARALNRAFGGVRDALQRKEDWNCCTAWVKPALELTPSAGPLANRFFMPPDCLKIRFVEDLAENEWQVEAVEGEEEAMVLVTSATAPRVCYSKRVLSPALWDASLLEVFALKLAAAVAPEVAKNKGISADLRAQLDKANDDAAAIDAKEGSRGTISRDTSWVRARGGRRFPR